MLIVFSILFVLVIIGAFLQWKSYKKEKVTKDLSDAANRMTTELGITPTKTLSSSQHLIGIDLSKKKVCVVSLNHSQAGSLFKAKVLSYYHLYKVELEEDKEIVSSRQSSLIGGIMGASIAGPFGFVLGSRIMGETVTKEVVKGHTLRLCTADIDNPLYTIVFTDKEEAYQWYSFFTSIIEEGKKITPNGCDDITTHESSEILIAEEEANLWESSSKATTGWLKITDKAVIFEPSKTYHSTTDVGTLKIDASDINSIERHSFFGVVPTGISITQKDGSKIIFALGFKRDGFYRAVATNPILDSIINRNISA